MVVRFIDNNLIVAILDGTSGRSFLLWDWDYWTGIIVSLPVHAMLLRPDLSFHILFQMVNTRIFIPPSPKVSDSVVQRVSMTLTTNNAVL